MFYKEAVMPKQRIGHIGLFSSFFEGLVGDETAETAEDGQKTVVNWPYLSTHIWVWGVCAGESAQKDQSQESIRQTAMRLAWGPDEHKG